MSNLKELKQEADELGVKYSPNIGESKLADKINEYYESKETNEKLVEEAVAEKEATVEEMVEAKEAVNKSFRQIAREMERDARKTRVITIMDNDQRVNNQTTSVTVTCDNMHFALGTIVLPLDMEVEVMQVKIYPISFEEEITDKYWF